MVLLTGATGGIGAQLVADYINEGAIVACLIRNKAKMTMLRNELIQNNIPTANLHDFECDILNFEDVKRVVNLVGEKLKRIDILVNCAGFAHEYPFAMMNVEHVDQMLDVNLKSPIYLSQAVLRFMYKQKEGCIINVSSIASIKKGRGIAVYAAAKAGLESFTRTLAMEVGRKNIRVNSIRPGVISTTMSEPLLSRAGTNIIENTSLARVGLPKEITAAILFMSSNKTASFMTGETITIDGGLY